MLPSGRARGHLFTIHHARFEYVPHRGPRALSALLQTTAAEARDTLEYEEGILLDLALCLPIAVLYMVRTDLNLTKFRRVGFAFAALAISTVMYFAKTTALLTLAVVVLILITSRAIDRRFVALWLASVILPFALWTNHNHAVEREIRWSSSWTGENLFRGYNAGAAAVFPEISLDRVFDSTKAIIGNGKVVSLGNFSNLKCFNGEWAWNDYYAGEAVQWVRQHFLAALLFDLRKA